MDRTAKKDYLLPHEKLGTYFVENMHVIMQLNQYFYNWY